MELSVIICSHNPRREFLTRCIDALKIQDFPLSNWELLLVDNASDQPLSQHYDLSWHPHARHVREDILGIAPTRVRGMREAKTDLILFVDDDNLLEADYIKKGLGINQQHPNLGCWGGQLLPEFEEEPEEWTRQWWPYLAIRPLGYPVFSFSPKDYDAIPPTAGMFLRRSVWERYLQVVDKDPRHLWLGLKGNKRISGQDTDIALCSFDLDYTTGRFPELVLTHIMPKSRLTVASLTTLIESISYSTVILEGLRNSPTERFGLIKYGLERIRAYRLPMPYRACYTAELKGRWNAWKKLSAEKS